MTVITNVDIKLDLQQSTCICIYMKDSEIGLVPQTCPIPHGMELTPPFFLTLFTYLFSIKISLLFHLFFKYLTCLCPHSYNIQLTCVDSIYCGQ